MVFRGFCSTMKFMHRSSRGPSQRNERSWSTGSTGRRRSEKLQITSVAKSGMKLKPWIRSRILSGGVRPTNVQNMSISDPFRCVSMRNGRSLNDARLIVDTPTRKARLEDRTKSLHHSIVLTWNFNSATATWRGRWPQYEFHHCKMFHMIVNSEKFANISESAANVAWLRSGIVAGNISTFCPTANCVQCRSKSPKSRDSRYCLLDLTSTTLPQTRLQHFRPPGLGTPEAAQCLQGGFNRERRCWKIVVCSRNVLLEPNLSRRPPPKHFSITFFSFCVLLSNIRSRCRTAPTHAVPPQCSNMVTVRTWARLCLARWASQQRSAPKWSSTKRFLRVSSVYIDLSCQKFIIPRWRFWRRRISAWQRSLIWLSNRLWSAQPLMLPRLKAVCSVVSYHGNIWAKFKSALILKNDLSFWRCALLKFYLRTIFENACEIMNGKSHQSYIFCSYNFLTVDDISWWLILSILGRRRKRWLAGYLRRGSLLTWRRPPGLLLSHNMACP